MALWSIYPEVFSMKANQISEGRGFRISYRQNHWTVSDASFSRCPFQNVNYPRRYSRFIHPFVRFVPFRQGLKRPNGLQSGVSIHHSISVVCAKDVLD
jgi:hypothetical protein